MLLLKESSTRLNNNTSWPPKICSLAMSRPPRELRRIVTPIFWQHIRGDIPTQPLIVRQVHHTHLAFAELAQDLTVGGE